MKKKSSYEGLQGHVRGLKTPLIEVWKNQYTDRRYLIKLDVPEFTCICPKTGLPDFAQLTIEYVPDMYCLELKSFKMYTMAYRQVGVFHEHVLNKISDDIIRACMPRWLKITGVFNPRGGITTTVTREYTRENKSVARGE
jgi:7-cyano-7-deazaguanine reductase